MEKFSDLVQISGLFLMYICRLFVHKLLKMKQVIHMFWRNLFLFDCIYYILKYTPGVASSPPVWEPLIHRIAFDWKLREALAQQCVPVSAGGQEHGC